ncbi:hypothetical protein F5X68DRAFT_219951 [Plectosphaerella plurivora]|uniref:BZIP domain-containing protein n=1 Tax=Plectosphaerella plurivora TaxID=936078 RepID=A0A9P8VL95_9PEZI|nr:hypothetical protein F5X68DRAFT_219951 [Plectosphaerella plurivora]
MQEMSILNAESYNDGTSSFRPPRSISDLKNTAPTRASLPSRRSKDTLKRTKDETVDQSPKDAEEPPRKRGRGRPKLSNSEESPAERRRVQIRLAQRNYRSRKERNVVILEQKIKDLDRVAADMSQAFTQLHDFALARGMLESDPEFGRRLQATTQTFLTLARKSHEIVTAEIVDVDKQQGASGEQHDANPSKDTPAVSATSPGMSPEKKSGGNNTASAGSSSGDQQVLMAGLIVTHEPVMNYTEAIAPPPPSTAAAHAPPGSWSQNDPSPSASSSHHHPAASAKTYEVVSHPTVHNASFPFGMSLETPETTAMPITTTTTTTSANPHNFPFHVDLDASGFVDPSHTTIPDPYPPSFFSQYSPATGLDPSLPPSSFAYLERTFGRRLQRTALERGLRLLHMPDPPPHFFAAVFGFCLLFESRESIVKRMTDCTSVNEKETLSNWRFPFLQLGGAGTFFPELNEMDDPDMALNLQDAIIGPGNLGFGVSSMASAAAEGDEYQQQQQQQPENTPRIGNRGLLEPHRSKIAPDSMFGQGPWTPEIENTRDLRVDRKLRIVVPGWEGDFYDCDEVEWYLQQRGVVIPPAADFVTAEIDQDDFLGGQKAGPTKAFDATIDNFINDWLMKDFRVVTR